MVRDAGLLLLLGTALALPPISGHVVDGASAPIAGAEIRIVALDEGWRPLVQAGVSLPIENVLAQATTSEDGSFVVPTALPPGRHAIACGRPGAPMTLRWRERIDFAAGAPSEINLTLPSTVPITGIVLDAKGAPVAGVPLTAWASDDSSVTVAHEMSDPTGHFAFALPLADVVTIVGATSDAFGRIDAPMAAAPSLAIHLRSGDVASTASAIPSLPPSGTAEDVVVTIICVDPARHAIEGAIARVVSAGSATPAGSLLPVAASAYSGFATLRGRLAEPWTVVVEYPAQPSIMLEGLTNATTLDGVIGGATLRGVVRDQAGRPIAAANVAAEPGSNVPQSWSTHAGRRRTTTDGDGRFRIDGLAGGTHIVGAATPGFLDVPGSAVPLAAGQVTDVTLTLPSGATLHGSVVDEAGPVAGAILSAQQESYDRSRQQNPASEETYPEAISDVDGRFAIGGLEPDTWYNVRASAEWHEPTEEGGRPSEGPLSIEMRATGSIVGLVTGDALDAGVTCDSRPLAPGERGESIGTRVEAGRFVLSAPPANYTCVAHELSDMQADVVRQEVDGVVVSAGRATPISFHLKWPPFVTVSVVDAETGAPIASALIRCGSDRSFTGPSGGEVRRLLPCPSQQASETADANARDANGMITVSAFGYDDASIQLGSGEKVLVRMRPAAQVDVPGRVQHMDGEPVAGAEILVKDRPVTTSGEDGRFLVRLPGGRGRVAAAKVTGNVLWEGDAFAEGNLNGQLLTIDARPSELGEVLVRVRTPAGPLPGASVQVSGGRSGLTDTDGNFLVRLLKPRRHPVIVEAEGWGTCARDADVESGERTVVTCDLDAPWWLEGRVVRAQEPVAGASVQASNYDASVRFNKRTRADGTFKIGPVPGSTAELEVSVSGDAGERALVASRGGPPLVLDLAGVRVEGRIVAGDASVAGASVMLKKGSGAYAADAETDASGHFRFAALGGESWTVQAEAPEGRASAHFEAPTEGTLDLGDIRLTRATITGRVIPTEDISVFILLLATPSGDGVGVELIEVAEDGSFTGETQAGSLLYCAWPDDRKHAPVLGRMEPGAPLVLTFPPAATLELLVDHGDGLPPRVTIELVEWNGMPRWHPLMHSYFDADGLTFPGLPAGHVVVEVKAGGRSLRVEADLRHGETTRQEIDLP